MKKYVLRTALFLLMTYDVSKKIHLVNVDLIYC